MNIKWSNIYTRQSLILEHLDGRIEEILIDHADIVLLKNYHWCWTDSDKTNPNAFYAATSVKVGNKRTLKYLHQILIPIVPQGYEIDHANRDTHDNRRCNLRVVTRQQNAQNRHKPRNNTSGCSGVSFVRHKLPNGGIYGSWEVCWRENGKNKLQNFKSKEKAIAFRKQKAKEVYGQFAGE